MCTMLHAVGLLCKPLIDLWYDFLTATLLLLQQSKSLKTALVIVVLNHAAQSRLGLSTIKDLRSIAIQNT